ncbi:MAG TPA: V-type ATPase subunit [Longimicrobiales bacterium]
MAATPWPTLNARAAGMATHLLAARELRPLAHAASMNAFAEAIGRHGATCVPDEPVAATLELALRRAAAAQLSTLTRWAPSADSLFVLELEQDQRSLTVILRGLAAATKSAERIAGLLPTRSLPEAALQRLSTAAHPQQIGALLIAWQHPLAQVVVDNSAEPLDTLRVETALAREFARFIVRRIRHPGARFRAYVRESLDVLNITTALALLMFEEQADVDAFFVPGGARVTRVAFAHALKATSYLDAASILAAALDDSTIALALRAWNGEPDLERRLLRARAEQWRVYARRDPLSCAPTIAYLLDLRLELSQLQCILWGLEARVPGDVIEQRLWLP